MPTCPLAIPQTALCLVMKSRKLHPDEKRIYEVKVRLNLKEKQKLDGIIRISNVHAPDVFRMLLMKGKLPDAAVPALDIQTYYELRKLAANYNQYVKAIHQSRITNIDWEIAKQLTDVLEIIRNKIRKL